MIFAPGSNASLARPSPIDTPLMTAAQSGNFRVAQVGWAILHSMS